jgi:L-lactate dehydrogenase complex protein LldG
MTTGKNETGTIMSDKSVILQRVREALREPAPPRHLHHAPGPHHDSAEPTDSFRAWLPPVGSMWEEQIALFQKNAEMLKAEVFLCGNPAEISRSLQERARTENWRKIATHASQGALAVAQTLNLPMVQTRPGYNPRDIESCDIGLTECDALVAQTGSVLVTSHSAGGRVLSILPPHHVVLARRSQLVPDLEAAFAVLRNRYAEKWPSMISFITGPSRTGDIERILVLGAHGPKRLSIYVSLDS